MYVVERHPDLPSSRPSSLNRHHAYLHVAIINHFHLRCAYGPDVGCAAMQQLAERLGAWGHVTHLSAGHCLLRVAASETLRLAEDILVQCSFSPIEHLGITCLLALAVGPVDYDGHPDALLTIESSTLGWCPSLPAVQYTEQWRASYQAHMQIALDFVQALRGGHVGLAFQPVKQPHDTRTECYREALLRIAAPSNCREAGPADVITSLETLGLVRLLDYCVVSKAIALLQADPTVKIGCNLSAKSAVNDSWWLSTVAALSDQPKLAKRLVLELTETVAPDALPLTARFLSRLKALGAHLALDDFGTGASGFALVQCIPFDIIKLDQRYLQNARLSLDGKEMLHSLVNICKRLAPEVVIEGVETISDLMQLKPYRDNVWTQGFFTGKPLGWVQLEDPTQAAEQGRLNSP